MFFDEVELLSFVCHSSVSNIEKRFQWNVINSPLIRVRQGRIWYRWTIQGNVPKDHRLRVELAIRRWCHTPVSRGGLSAILPGSLREISCHLTGLRGSTVTVFSKLGGKGSREHAVSQTHISYCRLLLNSTSKKPRSTIDETQHIIPEV